MKRYFSFLLLFSVLVVSCQLDEMEETVDDPLDKPVLEGQMLGKIKFPERFPMDTTGIKVVSSQSNTHVDRAVFVIDTIGNFSTLYLTNKSEEIIMMRYNYPGQVDNDISVESTALAMFMADPIVVSLTSSARTGLIAQIVSTPDYGAFVQEVSKTIISGKPITDPSNLELAKSLGQVFKTASNLRLQSDRDFDKPIIFRTQVSGSVSFENNNIAHNYAVGIYKRGHAAAVNSFVIKGTPMMAESYSDAIAGIFKSGDSSPDKQDFSFTEDGFYDIKVKSGFGLDNSNSEFKQALKENAIEYVKNLVEDQVPDNEQDCLEALSESISKNVESQSANFKTENPSEYIKALGDIAVEVLKSNQGIIQNCSPQNANFLGNFGQLINFSNLSWQFGNQKNTSAQLHDLLKYKASIDTCLRIFDKKLISCRWYKMVFGGNENEGKEVSQEEVVNFIDGEKQQFNIVFDDSGLKDNELILSQVKVENVSNKDISVQLKYENTHFSLSLTAANPEGLTTTFDITYKGMLVQTFNAGLFHNAKDFVVEISTYHPELSKVKPVFTLKPNDKITLRNRLIEYIRLKYKGEYVKIEGIHDALRYHFEFSNYPITAEDHHIDKYTMTFHTQIGNEYKIVKFPIDLTLSNEIYRKIVGKSITGDFHRYGFKNVKVFFGEDMTGTLTFESGQLYSTFFYSFNYNGPLAHYYNDCGMFGLDIDQRIVGVINLSSNYGFWENRIILFEDGTLRAGSYPAICLPPPGTTLDRIDYRF